VRQEQLTGWPLFLGEERREAADGAMMDKRTS